MRTDPRQACANAVERLGWALLHDAIAHPLMAVTNYAGWAVRFHDWTSWRAWPRTVVVATGTSVLSHHHGKLLVLNRVPGFYEVQHPVIRHKVVVGAVDAIAAVEQAEAWFDSLADVGIYPPKLP